MFGESDAADVTPGDVIVISDLNIVISAKRETFKVSFDALLLWRNVTMTDFVFLPQTPVRTLFRCSA